MKQATQIFDKSHLKVAPELQDEIIRRFNDYDTLTRVIKIMSRNIKTTIQTSKGMNSTDKSDLYFIANTLLNSTNPEWLKENSLYY